MNDRKMRWVLVVVGFLSFSLTAVGQFTYTGVDAFSDNTLTIGPGNRWESTSSSGTGTSVFSETMQRLEYTGLTNGGVSGRRMLTWYSATTGNPSYGESWTSTVFASNLATGLTAFAQIGLEVYNPATEAGYFGVYLYRDTGADTKIYVTNRTFNGTSYVETSSPWSVSISGTTASNVELGIAYDAGTGKLSAIYRLDTGSSFTVLDAGSPGVPAYATVSPASTWAAAPTSGFGFRVSGHSSLDTIGAGTLYLDEYAVTTTAVPEPATSSVVLGALALATATWLRRRRRS